MSVTLLAGALAFGEVLSPARAVGVARGLYVRGEIDVEEFERRVGVAFGLEV